MVDTAVEQLHRGASSSAHAASGKQVWLPRTQIAALVVRTREAAQLAAQAQPQPTASENGGLGDLVQAAREGLDTLGKVLKVYNGNVGDAEASLGVGQAVAAAVGGGGFGFGPGGGGAGFRF